MVAFVCAACVACTRNRATFVLTNDAAQPILSATVDVSGEIVELSRIESGRSATRTVAFRGDGDYHITVRFHRGGCSNRRLGYGTSRMNFRDEFWVTDRAILLTKADVTSSYKPG